MTMKKKKKIVAVCFFGSVSYFLDLLFISLCRMFYFDGRQRKTIKIIIVMKKEKETKQPAGCKFRDELD
jgi:hypothetical protein